MTSAKGRQACSIRRSGPPEEAKWLTTTMSPPGTQTRFISEISRIGSGTTEATCMATTASKLRSAKPMLSASISIRPAMLGRRLRLTRALARFSISGEASMPTTQASLR
jgi:hypothetical protein